ncbi:hypothetical protein J2T56_000090 [Natronobacillus azotifigens]
MLLLVSKEVEKIEGITELTPTCQMGCAFCCYFPIIITEMEAKLIKQVIQNFPEERKVKVTEHLA